MGKDELLESIEKLRLEVEKLEDVKDEISEKITGLIGDVEHAIEHPDDTAHRETVTAGLQSVVEQFELEHPNLTGALNHVMVTLSNMGI